MKSEIFFLFSSEILLIINFFLTMNIYKHGWSTFYGREGVYNVYLCL